MATYSNSLTSHHGEHSSFHIDKMPSRKDSYFVDFSMKFTQKLTHSRRRGVEKNKCNWYKLFGYEESDYTIN
jgi:hypothetical protein